MRRAEFEKFRDKVQVTAIRFSYKLNPETVISPEMPPGKVETAPSQCEYIFEPPVPLKEFSEHYDRIRTQRHMGFGIEGCTIGDVTMEVRVPYIQKEGKTEVKRVWPVPPIPLYGNIERLEEIVLEFLERNCDDTPSERRPSVLEVLGGQSQPCAK